MKGANFTAKRGTAVRGIALTDNPEHIGRQSQRNPYRSADLLCQEVGLGVRGSSSVDSTTRLRPWALAR